MEEKEKQWAEHIAEKIFRKVIVTAERNRYKIPYTTQDGVFDDWSDRIGWWTNGFFGGQLWLLYHAFGYDLFRTVAQEIEEKLDRNLMDYQGMDHDSGFRWLMTSVANYRLTGNWASKNRGLLAAANLAGRFNLAGGFIRAWNDGGSGENAGWAIIDCMMNLPLLYWASEQTNDDRFAQIARAHADMARQAFVREDGSVNHIVEFDQKTGEMIRSLGGQGMKEGSSWTRGQSWALYGFSLSYRHTGDKKYLETAQRIAAYILSQIPGNGIIPVDFCQPKDCDWEDSSAAAIMACGFLELEQYVDAEEGQVYREAALHLLHTLEEKRCCFDENIDHIVENCTAAYNDEHHNFAIIYADYFFTEAIMRLCGKNLLLW